MATSVALLLAFALISIWPTEHFLVAQFAVCGLAGIGWLLAPHVGSIGRLGLRWLRTAHGCWAVLIGWQVIQLLPLPCDWLAYLSPYAHAAWAFLGEGDEEGRCYLALSYWRATQALITTVMLYALWNALLLSAWRKPARQRFYLAAVVVSGSAQALYGALGALAGFEIAPIEPSGFVHTDVANGTFANRNHYAAFLVLALCCSLGMLFFPSGRVSQAWGSFWRRLIDWTNSSTLLVRVLLFIIAVSVVLSESRMGNTALFTAIVVFAATWLISNRKSDKRSIVFGVAVFTSIAVIDLLVIDHKFGLGRVVERVENTRLGEDPRADALDMGQRMLTNVGWAGGGAGAFRNIEHQMRERMESGVFVHAHNDYQQMMIELGVPGSLALLCLIAAHLLHALELLRSDHARNRVLGAVVISAVAAAALHLTVEFLMQSPAYSFLFVWVMALGMSAQRFQKDERLMMRRCRAQRQE